MAREDQLNSRPTTPSRMSPIGPKASGNSPQRESTECINWVNSYANWKWNEGTDAELGNVWQPFPIQTFMPESEDVMLSEVLYIILFS